MAGTELRVSRSRYLLNLCTAQQKQENCFIDMYDTSIDIKKAVMAFIDIRCKNTQKYYGNFDCSYCNVPEDNPEEKISKDYVHKGDDCPQLKYKHQKQASCYECKDEEKVILSSTLRCNEIKMRMAYTHGSYDVIQLWKVPDFYWGMHITMETQEKKIFSDIMSIPCHRVRDPDPKKDDHEIMKFREPIICFTFVELNNEQGSGIQGNNIVKLRDNIYGENGKEGLRLSMFVSYGYFPVVIKSEFENENLAHEFILKLREYEMIKSTSTMLGINPKFLEKSEDSERISIKEKDGNIKVNSKRKVRYIVAIKVNKTGIKDDLDNDKGLRDYWKNKKGSQYINSSEYFIRLMMEYEIDKYNEEYESNKGIIIHKISLGDPKSPILNRGIYHMRGFWDCFIPIISTSSFATTEFVIRHLRSKESIRQVISIPIWDGKKEDMKHE